MNWICELRMNCGVGRGRKEVGIPAARQHGDLELQSWAVVCFRVGQSHSRQANIDKVYLYLTASIAHDRCGIF